MNLKQNFSILFHLNSAKQNKYGLCPIYIRITLDGKRAEISTGRQIEPDHWDQSLERASARCIDHSTLNEFLDLTVAEIKKRYNILLTTKPHVTAEDIKKNFLGIKEQKMTFLKLFQQFLDHLTVRLEIKDISPKRHAKFKMLYEKCQKYIKKNYNRTDLFLEEVKLNFLVGFEIYLRAEYHVAINTSMKSAKELKQVAKYGIIMEYIPSNPFEGFRSSYKKTKREYLTKDELETIWKKELNIKRLEEVRDCYVFSCYTGFAYVDVLSMAPEHITKGLDGETWIQKDRKKTNTTENVPLLPIALEILEKYKNHPYCVRHNKILPVNSNQRYNAYLKELADICEINKRLTTHTARHTFATTVLLSNGVPIETTMELLGHKDIKTTLIYGKIVQQKVSQDMKVLKEKLFKESQQNSNSKNQQ